MAYLNIYVSLGWVNDERVVSVELPSNWDEMTEEQKDLFKDDEYQDAVSNVVESWTTESEEPEADEW